MTLEVHTISKLKAGAVGVSFETVKVEGEVRQTLDVSWEQALKRVYGPAANPAPPAVVVVVEAKLVGDRPSEPGR